MCSEDGEKQVLIGNGKAADKNPNSDPPTSNISTSNASSTSDIHVSTIRCILIAISAFFSYSMASGFNFGIAAAMIEAQSNSFLIPLDRSSWTASIHTGVCLLASMLQQIY